MNQVGASEKIKKYFDYINKADPKRMEEIMAQAYKVIAAVDGVRLDKARDALMMAALFIGDNLEGGRH